MNSPTSEVPSINLPPPVMGGDQAPDPNMASLGIAETASPPTGVTPPINPVLPPVILPVPSAPLQTFATSAVANTTYSTNPGVAEDADLIEKEWVQKAKDIIKKTQNDPHVQSRELNIFKADYMQKRYNKVLKQSE